MSIAAIIIRDTATPYLVDLLGVLTPQRMAAAIGPRCARFTQQWLRGLGTNERGWPTTNFWARAAKSTSWAPVPEGALISINQIGVRQRWLGGRIEPVNAKALAIPISPVSYGHVPADFPGLFLLRTKKGAYLVQHGAGIGAASKTARLRQRRGMGGHAMSRADASLNFLFKLSAGVNQAGDPRVMPSRDGLAYEAKTALLAAVRTTGGRNG